ncbi:MAG TPA: NAD-dependent succinate-semialdehyde dehydrogenase [Polyangiaceae bacterium]|nr:NAD-dependent succinate-semialdehyde dehydrogenase [Polyangiaceae bacterium]
MSTTHRDPEPQTPPVQRPKTASSSAARPFATVNPYSGKTEKEYPFLPSKQVVPTIERGHEAFLAWRNRPVAERAAVVKRAGELMMAEKDALAALVTKEMGKLIGEAQIEVWLAASILTYYGEKGPSFLAEERVSVDKGEAVIANAPLGVLLGIEPWNFPLYQVVRFAAPNLVVGNTILLKHAEINPQCALALEKIFRDAGAPEGVYQNVFLAIADVETVIAHPFVQGISLTGSERAGTSVAEIAGRNLKKCVLELGGSDPFIVLDAPDMDRLVTAAVAGRLGNTGQSCVAAKRFLVVAELYDRFVDAFAARFAALQPGDPADPATKLGPLSSERAAADLFTQVEDALTKGATCRAGGKRPDLPGAFVEATVLTDVTPAMRAYSEELFGPVAVMYKVKDDEEAIAIANASSFGLGGSIFCSDLTRARRVADRIESGMVWINHPTSSQADLPFGGVKRSGFGRELSHLGMFEFTNKKLIRTFPAKTAPGKVAG